MIRDFDPDWMFLTLDQVLDLPQRSYALVDHYEHAVYVPTTQSGVRILVMKYYRFIVTD